jgi:hypothetical protein
MSILGQLSRQGINVNVSHDDDPADIRERAAERRAWIESTLTDQKLRDGGAHALALFVANLLDELANEQESDQKVAAEIADGTYDPGKR